MRLRRAGLATAAARDRIFTELAAATGAPARVLDSRADLRWGPDGKGFRRIVAPNGICAFGTWEITEDTPYTGFYAKGAKGLAIGPNNGLFVTSLNHQVFEFDATSGAFRRIFVTNPGNGGLFDPRSLVFIDNPLRCLVVGGVDNTVFAYNAATGAHLGTFNNGTNKGITSRFKGSDKSLMDL